MSRFEGWAGDALTLAPWSPQYKCDSPSCKGTNEFPTKYGFEYQYFFSLPTCFPMVADFKGRILYPLKSNDTIHLSKFPSKLQPYIFRLSIGFAHFRISFINLFDLQFSKLIFYEHFGNVNSQNHAPSDFLPNYQDKKTNNIFILQKNNHGFRLNLD